MHYYLQIDSESFIVFGVSQSQNEIIESPNILIEIDTYDTSKLGKVYDPTTGVFSEPPNTIEELKTAKLVELASARDTAIYTSFQSSALGTAKTYNYDKEAADNFRAKTALLALNTSINTVMWATIEDGFIEHSREQFVQVVTDGGNHEESLKMRYFQLSAQVQDATTESEVNAIVW